MALRCSSVIFHSPWVCVFFLSHGPLVSEISLFLFQAHGVISASGLLSLDLKPLCSLLLCLLCSTTASILSMIRPLFFPLSWAQGRAPLTLICSLLCASIFTLLCASRFALLFAQGRVLRSSAGASRFTLLFAPSCISLALILSHACAYRFALLFAQCCISLALISSMLLAPRFALLFAHRGKLSAAIFSLSLAPLLSFFRGPARSN